MTSLSPTELVADIEGRLRPLEIELAEAWWESNTNSSPEAEARRTAAELARRELLADPVLFGAVTDACEQLAADADALVRRQLDMLHDAFVPHQVAADLALPQNFLGSQPSPVEFLVGAIVLPQG